MSNRDLTSKLLTILESKRSLQPMEPIAEVSNEGLQQELTLPTKNSAYLVGESQASIRSINAHDWNEEYSKINYFSKANLSHFASDYRQSAVSSLNRSVPVIASEEDFDDKTDEEIIKEEFPLHVTNLMNESNYWGCFYNFPELYSDIFSPVVRIRNLEDVPELVGGVLTRDMVTACLSYLRRSPILGDLVYIKLDLSSKHLQNIDVLMHYKFLVCLDLSSNLLTELTVLSSLPYLQFLSVAFNRLSTVLEYDTPQWFLTEVHYKYNSVKRIRDLTVFWSLTILDLSHNNIKCITGLENLKFLRRLDLSFNHIQRLENLNHLHLLWLDVSYNNISSCEFGADAGLWTLLHLEYLNLNENNLTSMKMFSYCTRLRELHLRNNRLSVMLELPIYMRQMRRLIVLDLRANPIGSVHAYKSVVINTFPILLSLDAAELDPIEQRTLKMDTNPEITMDTTRKLLRLIYIEQLSKARVSPYVPPADTTDVPIVVLVGHEGVGKGTLSRRLVAECSSKIQLARQHTTSNLHFPNHYIEITRKKFDDMLLAGEFLTYSEMDGESYGLSREEAFVKEGKVKVVRLDLPAALMLKLRGYRPYLILTTCFNIETLTKTQEFRKTQRICYRNRVSLDAHTELSTLQVMLSGRIIISGVINEIIMNIPGDKDRSEFTMESECSLMMDSEVRQATKDAARSFNILALLNSSSDALDEDIRHSQEMEERSLYSLFKAGTTENTSVLGQHQQSNQERGSKKDHRYLRSKFTDKHSNNSRFAQGSSKTSSKSTSKSVTFTYQDEHGEGDQGTTSGLMVEPANDPMKPFRSISTRMTWPLPGWQARVGSHISMDESDLWLAFLTDAGFLESSDSNVKESKMDIKNEQSSKKAEDDFIPQINNTQYPCNPPAMGRRDAYERLHRQCPGLFWDTVVMDDPEEAFINVRKIIRNIVNSQKKLRPMFDIDFAHLPDYPTVERKLVKIRKQIAPQQLFY